MTLCDCSRKDTCQFAKVRDSHGDRLFEICRGEAEGICEDTSRQYRARWAAMQDDAAERSPAPVSELYPCPHRGGVTRVEKCKPCLGNRLVSVYQCSNPEIAVGECTVCDHKLRHPSGGITPVCMICEHLPENREENREPHTDVRGNPSQALSKSGRPRPVRDPDASEFQRGEQVGGFLVNSIGIGADCLEGQMRGSGVFLACGGPSFADVDAGVFSQRGVVTAAVNQVAATHLRPHYWFSVDEPAKFHEAIWLDPGIAKFVMRRRSRERVRQKNNEGGWDFTGRMAREYPNTWFYEYQMGFDDDGFLTMSPPTWGRQGLLGGSRRRETKSVMLVAIRFLYWLGFRRIYLMGCDFRMTPDRSYAFNQPKDLTASNYNNNSYSMLNEFFASLRPEFEKSGLEVLNTTPMSGLTAFKRARLEDCIKREAIQHVDDVNGLYILHGRSN